MTSIGCSPDVPATRHKIHVFFKTPLWWRSKASKPRSGLSGGATKQLTINLSPPPQSSRISCGSHTQSWRTIIQQNIYTCSEQCHLAETPAEVTRYDGTGICTFRGLLCAPLRQNSWTTIFARCCPGWRTPPGLNDRTLAGLRGTQLNVKTNDVMVPILRDGVQTLQMGYNLLVHQDLHLHDVEGVWIRWQGKTCS